MQCSVMSSNHNSGIVKMKNSNNHKNPNKKELNPDIIVDQLCTRLEDIKDQESASQVGMPTCSIEQAEAVRRYYAAFPALKKGQESPQQYYLPPPAWCRKSEDKSKMQSSLTVKESNFRSKKFSKERRNSYHGQRRSRKRSNSHSRSLDELPEWVTAEGVWDMDAMDPVKEFIRALALDEGYGTCENTVADEPRVEPRVVPDWDDGLDLDAWVIGDDYAPKPVSPMEEELYAKFEAKFDRSIEALWANGENTPDDDYQELPIDFRDLLASPEDKEPWAVAPGWGLAPRPLILPPPPPFEPYAEIYAPFPPPEPCEPVARSYAALNHRREYSGFVEVPPRTLFSFPCSVPGPQIQRPVSGPVDDPLTASRTHFRPIKRAPVPSTSGPRLEDGATFEIHAEIEPVAFSRSASGSLYAAGCSEPYLEYRPPRTIDYGRLRLTPAQRCQELEEAGLTLRFRLRQSDASTQTEPVTDRKKARGNDANSGIGTGGLTPGEEVVSEGNTRKRRARGACSTCCGRPHARLLRCPPTDRPLTR